MARRFLVSALVVAAVAALIVATQMLGSDAHVRSSGAVGDAGTALAAQFPPSSIKSERVSPFVLPASVEPLPVEIRFEREPAAGILFDVDSGEVLWEHNSDQRLPIASLTKMLTALLIAERHRPGENVAVTPEALAYEGSGMGVLPKGKQVKLESLLEGLILVSGNDAAIALAQHDAGSVDAFVRRMNRSRTRFGLSCSHFTSPHGLQDEGNYSCARDLAALARADLANRRISAIMRSGSARFPFPIKGGSLDLYNNNPFIRNGTAGITGVKTGNGRRRPLLRDYPEGRRPPSRRRPPRRAEATRAGAGAAAGRGESRRVA